ncbi:metal-dependent hydrolase [Pelagibius sp.]|uniref:metal-dependent hydrolase n=1 Tax=Pelagibius sp. TaxID=1931238 RepID=UPI003BAE75C0
MKSPTHFLIGYGCAAAFGWRGGLRRACLLGAVVPDVPVAAVWSVLAASVVWREGGYVQALVQAEMDALYFSDSVMIALHNLLHGPLSLAGLTLLTLLIFCRNRTCRMRCLAFLAGAVTHAVVDIVSHVTDGPLVLWPLDDELRLVGPFSHWDPAYGGLWVTGIELAAALVFGVASFFGWRRRRAMAVPVAG